jgi:hypothetical protein
MKLVKSKNWTRLNDLKYYFWRLPLTIIRAIPYILIHEPKINDMHWRHYIGMAQALADMQTGRIYVLEE